MQLQSIPKKHLVIINDFEVIINEKNEDEKVIEQHVCVKCQFSNKLLIF